MLLNNYIYVKMQNTVFCEKVLALFVVETIEL